MILSQRIKEIEALRVSELGQPISIGGWRAEIFHARSMGLLHREVNENDYEMPNLPELAKLRVAPSELQPFFWKYGWMSESAISRVCYKGKDYGIFIHINPFVTEEKRIRAYQKALGDSSVQLEDSDIDYILEKDDGQKIIVVPFDKIRNSPRGMIPLSDIVRNQHHVVALGAFGNDKELLEEYIAHYIRIMEKSPFTPTEMGVWFSEDAKPNTMRSLELGDSGIGIYARNLTNKVYRAIGMKK